MANGIYENSGPVRVQWKGVFSTEPDMRWRIKFRIRKLAGVDPVISLGFVCLQDGQLLAGPHPDAFARFVMDSEPISHEEFVEYSAVAKQGPELYDIREGTTNLILTLINTSEGAFAVDFLQPEEVTVEVRAEDFASAAESSLTQVQIVADAVNGSATISRLDTLEARFNPDSETSVQALLQEQSLAYADADEALSERIDTISASINDETTGLLAQILGFQQSYVNNETFEGLATELNDVRAQLDTPEIGVLARLTDIDTALFTPTTGLAERTSIIEAALETFDGDITAAIEGLSSVYVDAETFEGAVGRVDTLEGQINEGDNSILARLNTTEDVIFTPNTGLVQRVNNLTSTIGAAGGIISRLTNVENTYVTTTDLGSYATASRVGALESIITGINGPTALAARISTIEDTFVTSTDLNQYATTSRVDNLESVINGIDSGPLEARITTIEDTFVSEGDLGNLATAQQVTQLSSEVEGAVATVESSSETIASLEGYVSARSTLQVDANGVIAGVTVRSESDGALINSDVTFGADKIVYEADGEVVWYADAGGLTMNKAIRWVAGGTPSNPDTMYVLGLGFGANGDLMEWFGPYSATVDGATADNGIRAKTTEGKTYLGGVEEGAGAISISHTVTSSIAERTGVATNNNVAQITSGYTVTATQSYQSSSNLANGMVSAGSGSIRMRYGQGSSVWTNRPTVTATGTITTTSFFDPEFGQYFITRHWVLHVSDTFSLQGVNNGKYRTERIALSIPTGFISNGQSTSISIFEPA